MGADALPPGPKKLLSPAEMRSSRRGPKGILMQLAFIAFFLRFASFSSAHFEVPCCILSRQATGAFLRNQQLFLFRHGLRILPSLHRGVFHNACFLWSWEGLDVFMILMSVLLLMQELFDPRIRIYIGFLSQACSPSWPNRTSALWPASLPRPGFVPAVGV